MDDSKHVHREASHNVAHGRGQDDTRFGDCTSSLLWDATRASASRAHTMQQSALDSSGPPRCASCSWCQAATLILFISAAHGRVHHIRTRSVASKYAAGMHMICTLAARLI